MNDPMTPPQAPRRRGHAGVIIAGSVALLLAAGAVTFALVRDGEKEKGSPSVSGSTVAPTPTAEPSTSAPAPSATPTTAPVNPAGKWQLVTAQRPSRAYLIPDATSGWASQPTDQMAYVDAKGQRLVLATSPSYYRPGYCASKSVVARAWVGWSSQPGSATGAQSLAVNKAWVDAVSLRRDGQTHDASTPVQTKLVPIPGFSGQSTVHSSTVTVSERDAAGCLPPKVEITTATFAGPGTANTLVMVRDLGVPDQLPDELRDRIIASARPMH